MNENPDESIVFDLWLGDMDTLIVCGASSFYIYRPFDTTDSRKLPFGLMLA